MYLLDHFGLTEMPFSLTCDPRHFYQGAERREILAGLVFALKRGDAVLKVTGEVGSGKSMLCRMLLHSLEGEDAVAYLNAPPSDRRGILVTLAREFGLDAEGDNEALLARLNDYFLRCHAAGYRVVVLIDEAQALGAEGLETVRLLSNLETDTDKLVQMVLFGQPELDAMLGRDRLRQLSQRITFRFVTRPLKGEEVAAYVRSRLRACSSPPRDEQFTKGALAAVVRASHGLPRMINILCDKALLCAYADGVVAVKPAQVRQAVRDSAVLGAPVPWHARPLARVAGLALLLLTVTAMTYGLLSHSGALLARLGSG